MSEKCQGQKYCYNYQKLNDMRADEKAAQGLGRPSGSVLTLKFNDGTERDYTEEDFNKLRTSGMLWEFHPDAPMEFPSH